MSYLNKMYGRNSNNLQSQVDKNPNRVTGGLKAQGVDSYKIVAEDGNVQEIPTQAYVRSLEEQLKKQRASIDVMDRRLTRQQRSIETIETILRSKNA
jgi:hypothetical protein